MYSKRMCCAKRIVNFGLVETTVLYRVGFRVLAFCSDAAMHLNGERSEHVSRPTIDTTVYRMKTEGALMARCSKIDYFAFDEMQF